MDTVKTGQFLAQLRRETGMTQEKLGEKLGVTNKTVSRWENGNYLPSVEMLQELSGLYRISINEILSAERLSETQYREKAEENIKTVLQSSFTLKERIDFYKKKWKRDHISTFIFGMIVTIALYISGIILNNGLQIAGYLWCVGFMLYQNNQMMIYVEQRAFDGAGS